MIQVVQVVQVVKVVQVVQVIRIISPDAMHSENIWICGLNHQIIKKSWDVTQVMDERLEDGGKWKIGQCSVRPETAIYIEATRLTHTAKSTSNIGYKYKGIETKAKLGRACR